MRSSWFLGVLALSSDRDDGLAPGMPRLQLAHGLRDLAERVRHPDDGGDLPRLDEILEHHEVVGVLLRDEHPQPLAHERRQYLRSELALDAAEPPTSPLRPDDDEGAVAGEGAP